MVYVNGHGSNVGLSRELFSLSLSLLLCLTSLLFLYVCLAVCKELGLLISLEVILVDCRIVLSCLLLGLSLCLFSLSCLLGSLIIFSIVSIVGCTIHIFGNFCNGKGSSAFLNLFFVISCYRSLDHGFGISSLCALSLLQRLLFLDSCLMIGKKSFCTCATGIYRTLICACGIGHYIFSDRLNHVNGGIVIIAGNSNGNYSCSLSCLSCLLSRLLCLADLLINLEICKHYLGLKTSGIVVLIILNGYRTVKALYYLSPLCICSGIGILLVNREIAGGHTYTHRGILGIILSLVLDKVRCIHSQRHSKSAYCVII